MALVSLDAAYQHIRGDWPLQASPADARDAELQGKVDQASDIILSYLKVSATSPESWDETTTPPRVQAATLLLVAHLWEHRGDSAAEADDEKLWEAIGRILVRDRDPALA